MQYEINGQMLRDTFETNHPEVTILFTIRQKGRSLYGYGT